MSPDGIRAAERAGRRRLPSGDRLLYLLLFLGGLAFVGLAVPAGVVLPLDAPDVWLNPRGPRFLPTVAGGGLCLLAAIGFLRSPAGPRNDAVDDAGDRAGGEKASGANRRSGREALVLALLAASLPLAPLVGLPAAGGLIGLALLGLAGRPGLRDLLLVAAAFPAAVWALFELLLDVPVPLGLLRAL